ncbi:MAG: acetyl-CoA carboxylase biotin carboxyl carrier protein subunit [Legionellales bacterium]|nr:acetyl-CoA carboxylase biotin carboxyl carrier protein subunit [Legionellales bacterium]|tara:strand:- start:680 stop:1102 length:423 start_codon:yes stop_codon:yes gene_type:complete
MDIEKVLKIFGDHPDLASLAVEEHGSRVELSRFNPVVSPTVPVEPVTRPTDVPISINSATLNHQICSPMVGTVYLSPSPGEPTYISIGDYVKQGDVLCLIEAMKMFNKIKADKSGYVVDIHVSNEGAVEFNQPIVSIEER